MAKLPRLLGSVSVRLSDKEIEFIQRLAASEAAKPQYPVLVVSRREGLRQGANPPVAMTGFATSPQVVLAEMGKIHGDAATVFARTLAQAQALTKVTAHGPSSNSIRAAALRRLTRDYLHGMLASTAEAGTALINALAQHAPLTLIVDQHRGRIHELSAVYLQHVQAILQSQEVMYDEKGAKPAGVGTP